MLNSTLFRKAVNNNTGNVELAQRGANDYNDNNFFSLQLSNIKIKTSIDLIRLSLLTGSFKQLDEELKKENYVIKNDFKLKKGNYGRARIYRNSFNWVGLIYKPKFPYRPQCLISLPQPCLETIEKLNSIFNRLSISTSIFKIELPFDFFQEDFHWNFFQEALEKHIFLKCPRNKSSHYEETYYTNNVRKSVKGIRVYVKDRGESTFVRLEVELHRRKIKELGITFSNLVNGVSFDMSKVFEFKKWDLEKILKFLIKKNRKRISDACKGRFGIKGGELVINHIKSYVEGLGEKPFMKAVESLRSYFKNFSRFLIPMKKENKLIQEIVEKQKFIMELKKNRKTE